MPLETLRPKDVVTEAEIPTDLDSPLRSYVQPEPSEHCEGRRNVARAWPVCPADLGDDELDFAAPAFPQPARASCVARVGE